MSSSIELRSISSRHYLGVRRVVKQEAIGAACAEILPRTATWLAERGIAPASPPLTIYHSVNRKTGDFDIQPGFFVSEPVDAANDLTTGRTADGSVLTATHVGPYETLGDTWHALFDRARELGRRVTKSSWEIYLDDPALVEPAKLRTQIFVPIEEA